MAKAKWELVASLPPEGHAILPADDSHLAHLIPSAPCAVTRFGFTPVAEVRARDVRETDKLAFLLEIGGQSAPVEISACGAFHVYNALAASACAWHMGMKAEDICEGLKRFKAPPMRMAVSKHPSGAIIVNDAYNANPESMKASLLSFSRRFPQHKRIAVLGGMLELGKEARLLHQEVGHYINELPPLETHVIGEEAKGILEGILEKGLAPEAAAFHMDKNGAREALRLRLGPGVAILFKASRRVRLEELISEL